MKITGQQLLVIADCDILGELSAHKLAPLGAWRLSRLSACVLPEAVRVQKARNALLTADNSTEIAPGMLQLKTAYAAEFAAAIAPLLAEVIDVDVKPLTLEDLKGAVLTANGIAALGPLLTE